MGRTAQGQARSGTARAHDRSSSSKIYNIFKSQKQYSSQDGGLLLDLKNHLMLPPQLPVKQVVQSTERHCASVTVCEAH